MSYFRNGALIHNGQSYSFSIEEAAPHEDRGNYWHGEGAPSTWLAAAIYSAVKAKLRRAGLDAPDLIPVSTQLAAQVLGVSVQALDQALDWNENYMRWHDGDDSYSIR